eukprot:PhM_4_TR15633/c0_g1_i1/m.78226
MTAPGRSTPAVGDTSKASHVDRQAYGMGMRPWLVTSKVFCGIELTTVGGKCTVVTLPPCDTSRPLSNVSATFGVTHSPVNSWYVVAPPKFRRMATVLLYVPGRSVESVMRTGTSWPLRRTTSLGSTTTGASSPRWHSNVKVPSPPALRRRCVTLVVVPGRMGASSTGDEKRATGGGRSPRTVIPNVAHTAFALAVALLPCTSRVVPTLSSLSCSSDVCGVKRTAYLSATPGAMALLGLWSDCKVTLKLGCVGGRIRRRRDELSVFMMVTVSSYILPTDQLRKTTSGGVTTNILLTSSSVGARPNVDDANEEERTLAAAAALRSVFGRVALRDRLGGLLGG